TLTNAPCSVTGADFALDLAVGRRLVGAVPARARGFVARVRDVDLVLVAMRSTLARGPVRARLAGARVSTRASSDGINMVDHHLSITRSTPGRQTFPRTFLVNLGRTIRRAREAAGSWFGPGRSSLTRALPGLLS